MRSILALVGLLGCGPDRPVDTEVCTDAIGPELRHTPAVLPQTAGDDLAIEVEAADPCGVRAVNLLVRVDEGPQWQMGEMLLVGETGDGWRYQARILGHNLAAPGIAYYFLAVDDSPGLNEACLPAECGAEPFWVEVAP